MVALLRCPTCRTSIMRPDDVGDQYCPRCGQRMRLDGISRGVVRTEVMREGVNER